MPPSDKPAAIDATFRNGTLTAYSVVVGFSLSFLTRWAGLPGAWAVQDVLAVGAIVLGIAAQILALAALLSVRSLRLERYERSVGLFLAGLALVCLGVLFALAGDMMMRGYGQRLLHGG